jgi:dihydroxy-acid dehydratase
MVDRKNTLPVIEETHNPYRDCIQGLANQPITVLKLLGDAKAELPPESPLAILDDVTMKEVVARLRDNRPRVAIILGPPDHPAHLLDRGHSLMAAARIWQNGGVPFAFAVPVICDGTAQNNIGQSYSLSSRNTTAAAVNITFEGHSYHAAYVLAGCDKSPTAIMSGLAAADVARAHRGNQAPVWALFAPEHVLQGGTIPSASASALRDLAAKARDAGHADLADDIDDNMKYILQCSSDEAFSGHLKRAENLGLVKPELARELLDDLAGATCHEHGGICAFNGTGNSSRTMLAAFGLTPPELELLTGLPPDASVISGIDRLFALFNKPEFRITEILRRNFGNVVRIHSATGSSSNLLLHLPCIMRHAGFDVTAEDYRRIRAATPAPEVFAHSLTEGRDTYELALQFARGQHRGMESLYRVLFDLGIPMDLDAPTVTGTTWGTRIANLTVPVDPNLGDRAVIRTKPLRPRAGVEILSGSFFDAAAVKVSGMSDALYDHFADHVFIVRFYENEYVCTADFTSADMLERLARTPGLDAGMIARVVARNGGDASETDLNTLLEKGWLSFAFMISGQGPRAYGMPEMFTPSQTLRHHRVLEASSILMTDGRYSGVTKGACLGHTVPEAFDGGGIGYLADGDVLRLDLAHSRLDVLDAAAFRAGTETAIDPKTIPGRDAIFAERLARMEVRRLDIAACNLMDDVSDAAKGVVPGAVDRRATRPWSA